MCGVFGVYGNRDAARIAYFGLYALQHRGQESAGMLVFDGERCLSHRGPGLVSDVFPERVLATLTGHVALGHVRYSTTGSPSTRNIQPFIVEHQRDTIAIAHNGNLTNVRTLRRELEKAGSIFQTTADSEIIIQLMVRSAATAPEERLAEALGRVRGAYSLALFARDSLIAARDPFGFRPLCLGRMRNAHVIASETCALDIIGATYVRDIEPGEILVINTDGLRSLHPLPPARGGCCVFEHIYFARPDSDVFGCSVYATRKALGRALAREHPADADMVIGIPDSGLYAALGYAEESHLPFEMGIIRNHYIGRTFIQPFQHMREIGARLKLNPIRDLIRGKRIVVVEDSIVRGTTGRMRISALRDAGAREIHLRISCPPIAHPCFYGIDFPTRDELIAASRSVEDIGRFISVDSIGYLSLDGMRRALPLPPDRWCTACFSGDYPDPVEGRMDKHDLEVNA